MFKACAEVKTLIYPADRNDDRHHYFAKLLGGVCRS